MSTLGGLSRTNLYWIRTQFLQAFNNRYPHINIGKVVADELTAHPPGRHISLEIDEFLRATLRQALASQSEERGLVLQNLGILLEPDLDLDPVKLFIEISRDATIVLVWDHAIVDGTHFLWNESDQEYGFVFPSHTITAMEIHDEIS